METPKKLQPMPDDFDPSSGEWLNTKKAAKYLRVSPHTLRTYRTKDIGPAYIRHPKGAWAYYRLSDLAEWRASAANNIGGRPKGSKDSKPRKKRKKTESAAKRP